MMRLPNSIENVLKSTKGAVRKAMLPAVALLSAYGAQTADADLALSQFNSDGQSVIVWSDDGSYGLQVLNKVDQFGNLRIIEYAKVDDDDFTRDSFTVNSDYTRAPLSKVFEQGGLTSSSAYGDRLTSLGALNPGSGWSLIDTGDGTHNIEHLEGIAGLDYVVPTSGNYAAKESTIASQDILDHILGTSINSEGVLVNANLDPFMQITEQDNYDWNLRSSSQDGFSQLDSTGINGQGIGVVPEPAVMTLIGIGGALMLGAKRYFSNDK